MLRSQNLPIYGIIVLSLTALSITPSAIGQSTYSWTLDCKRSGGLVGNVVAYWNCTANGVSIQGNTAFCSATPGGGTVPSNANGIIVRVTASFRNCFDQASATKSFTPGTVPSISLKAFCSTFAYGQRDTVSATFKLS